jgi:hypothetical protein
MKIYIKQNLHNESWFWQAVVDNRPVAVQPGSCFTAESCKSEFRLFAARMSAAALDTPEGEYPDFEFTVIGSPTSPPDHR